MTSALRISAGMADALVGLRAGLWHLELQGEYTLAPSAGCALKRGHRVGFLLPMLQGQHRGKPVECRNPVRGDRHGCR